MNLERVLQAASSASKNSVNLEKLFSKSVVTTNQIEEQRLRARTQLLEVRQKTYTTIQQSQQDPEKKDGIVEKVLGTLGLAGLAKGLKGAKPSTSGAGVVSPKPRPGGPRIGRGVAGLNVLFGGIDFLGRRSAGQSNLQAGIGAGAGVAGGLAGAFAGGQAGAAVGAGIGALFGGVGAAPGALIGGALGSIAGGFGGAQLGGNLADKLTGVDAGEQEVERRVQEEEKRTNLLITKTPFSGALDTFDAALDKLASFPGGICACAGREQPPSIQRTKDQILEAFERGYTKGVGDGRMQRGAPPVAPAGIEDLIPKPKASPAPRTDPNKAGTDIFKDILKTLPPDAIFKPPSQSKVPSPPAAQAVASRYIPRALGDLNTERPQEMVEEVIDTPEGQVSIRKPASKVEQSTSEEFFQKQGLNGIKKQINPLKRIRETLSPEKNSSVGFQNNMGGQNIIALAEPNTTIVPVPVGGGTQIIGGGGGASPYQAAAKYAQMMSQLTA